MLPSPGQPELFAFATTEKCQVRRVQSFNFAAALDAVDAGHLRLVEHRSDGSLEDLRRGRYGPLQLVKGGKP
jgi:hypothetical protein